MNSKERNIRNMAKTTKWQIDSKSKLVDPFRKDKEKRIREFRREASRLASKANKRLQRLEGNQLTDSPAYKKLVGDDGKRPRFSIRGKTYNEVQSEVARMNKFLNSQTSLVRGSNNVLKQMASNTGIKYENMKDLRSKAPKFFELSSKVEQYLRTVDDMATAIGYQKIWEAVNVYVEDQRADLGEAEFNIDEAIGRISEAIKEQEHIDILVSREDSRVRGWFKL